MIVIVRDLDQEIEVIVAVLDHTQGIDEDAIKQKQKKIITRSSYQCMNIQQSIINAVFLFNVERSWFRNSYFFM